MRIALSEMKLSWPLALALSATVWLFAGAQPCAASERAAVMATVTQFVTGLNKGDGNMLAAACASPAIIIDDFPPHQWRGPAACADWYAAFLKSNEEAGDVLGAVSLGAPWHVDITGAVAYVVVPAGYSYKHKGKPVVESGSVFTLAMKKTSSGWRIAGWAWADR